MSIEKDGSERTLAQDVAELCVMVAGSLIISVWAVVLLGFAIQGGTSLLQWKAGDWTAYGQMLTAVVSFIGLAGIFYGLYFQRQQLLDAKERASRERKQAEGQIAHLESQLEPNFEGTNVSVRLTYPDKEGRPRLLEYEIQIRNTGPGTANAVRAFLAGTGRHPSNWRARDYKELDDVPGNSDARPFTMYRNIPEEARTVVDDSDRPAWLPGDWRCGPLTIEYTNRRSQRWRVRYGFPPARYAVREVGGEPVRLELRGEREAVDENSQDFPDLVRASTPDA